MDLGETGWSVMNWIDLPQEGSCEQGNESLGSVKFLEILE
jgi:hypothetical protein